MNCIKTVFRKNIKSFLKTVFYNLINMDGDLNHNIYFNKQCTINNLKLIVKYLQDFYYADVESLLQHIYDILF